MMELARRIHELISRVRSGEGGHVAADAGEVLELWLTSGLLPLPSALQKRLGALGELIGDIARAARPAPVDVPPPPEPASKAASPSVAESVAVSGGSAATTDEREVSARREEPEPRSAANGSSSKRPSARRPVDSDRSDATRLAPDPTAKAPKKAPAKRARKTAKKAASTGSAKNVSARRSTKKTSKAKPPGHEVGGRQTSRRARDDDD